MAFSRLGAPAFVCSDARLAQLVERRLYTANVGGSIPSARTNTIKCLRLWIGPGVFYPYLEPGDVHAALAYTAWRSEERELPLATA